MTRPVVPIANLHRRIPEAGRIRFGVKTGRAMKALSTFRFTSHDEEALHQIAALYQGEVKPWSDPKAAEGQFEIITEASEIRIVLPPDPLGGTPIYEQWGGGGCERRCDGLNAEITTRGPDGAEMTEVPCICSAQQAMSCEPRTRLSVILPEIRFGGVWRLETKSWNAAQEMPGMVDLIQSLQERGLTRGVLALKHRRSVTAGETHKFIVPVLGIDETMEALAAGAAQVGALPLSTTAGELERGSDSGADSSEAEGEVAGVSPAAASNSDDDIVDAELVDQPATEPLESAEPDVIAGLVERMNVLPEEWRKLCKQAFVSTFGLPEQLTVVDVAEASMLIAEFEGEAQLPAERNEAARKAREREAIDNAKAALAGQTS